ncbi:MAG: hypothetical protein HMLKMBBP_00166 [Planctomycetes bacterium]|nr:hypothetical protein [Planctomycetota bacterium]
MLPFTFRLNAGMVAACVLLVAGAAILLAGGERWQTTGTGVLVLSAVVYFLARVKQMWDARRADSEEP